ncbi:specifically androgen-regulated gene protein-like isoform X2 [Stegastes partitus]|nr:PREDICTED: specifically androgen-regulated gene protein-like isoform X2 [Stegastes partitus]
MEHLSAEERACLMYLEETIEALEVQEDSGLSNDEPELGSQAEKMDQIRVNDISSLTSDGSGSHGMSTSASHLAESASTALSIEGKTEHHALNPTTEPQFTPASAADIKGLESRDLVAQPNLPGCTSNTQPEVLGSDAGDVDPKSTGVLLSPGQSAQASEVDEGLIPPPSDFMDEPDPPSQPVTVEDLLKSAGASSSKSGAPVDVELLRQRASANKPSVSSSVIEQPSSKLPSKVPPSLSVPLVPSGPLISPPPEVAEPKSPPVVAPKPKKLPANIILKSHKAAAAGSNGNSGHSVPTSSDRLVLDPQRVRMEALRKLGLLKSSESDSGPALSPKLSPKTRRSWAAPSPPISPAFLQTPPLTPSYSNVHSPPPTSVASPAAVLPTAASPAPSVEPPDILPAPAAFSDPISPLPSDNELSAIKDVTETTVNNPPLTPPALVKQLTPPRVTGIKSATLERSGLGLSSYKAEAGLDVGGQQSPSQLRNTRPRPASLGSGREFSNAKGGDLQAKPTTSKEPDSQRSLPAPTAPQHSRDSQKLPRSQGISVLICPRAENEEDRREALKKLGLLRD